MVSDREFFDISGPFHLDKVDWKNVNHRRTIAGSLVQGVYISERDRQKKREGSEALASPWWEFFHFNVVRQLVDDKDSSIFSNIYEYKSPLSKDESPLCVIAFRGTLAKPDSFKRDLKLDLCLIRNRLHQTSRCKIAIETVQNMVASFGDSNVWLVGHSLGSAMAMLAGKTMAKTGIFLETYLFNPPYVSAPIEKIKHRKLKHGIRVANSLITAGFTVALNSHHQRNDAEGCKDPFVALSAWIPQLFVYPADYICAEYVGYFQHRKKMEEMGAGSIEKLATQNSIEVLVMNAIKKDSAEPLHLLPSANMTVNMSPSPDFKQAHRFKLGVQTLRVQIVSGFIIRMRS